MMKPLSKFHRGRSRIGTIGFLFIFILAVFQTTGNPFAQASLPLVSVPPSETSFASGQGVFASFDLATAQSVGLKIHDAGDLYVVTNPSSPSFLEVVERLPSGGFGRILRYRGWTEERGWTDLEFVYQDKENRLTILDYGSGKFFRTTFTQKRENPFCLFPSEDEKGLPGDLTASQPTPSKFILASRAFRDWALPELHWLHSQLEGLSEEDVWSKDHVRGPPEGGLAL